jgi:hypothetical protein
MRTEPVPVSGVPRLERLYRSAAGLDVDKSDLKRHRDFLHHKIADLLLRGEANAKANGRDVIERWDLPITKGLQERIHEFRKLDAEVEAEPILEQWAVWPLLELELSVDTREFLPDIAGGLSVALAKAFTIIDPKLHNPATTHWERAFRVFDLLL